jgi:ubiquitin thioesterase protein OTUB1
MFQPQPAPFASFTSYGVGVPIPDFAGFQSSAAVGSGGPTLFRDPIFSPVATNLNNSAAALNFNNQIPQQYNVKMEPSDLEAQEALARDFQPALEGPLVGEKKSSHAITEEYAKADPIYVAKTAALPQKYSHYRPILGDGNCGWRAAGFAYFETLLRSQNNGQIEEEIGRIISLNNLISEAGGFQAWLFEDMVAETTTLLDDLANLVQTSPLQAAEDLLRERFNDPNVSASIVYHLRLLASSWLQANPALYQGFIPDGLGVDGYRKTWIDPSNQEIDHLGMTLLIDVLLKPIGVAVEIVYLDRSEGTQANSHIFQSEDSNGVPTSPGGPTIYLLYRPSHYDILYKDPVPPTMPLDNIPQNIQVHRVSNFSGHEAIQSTPGSMDFDMSALLGIPGFSLAQPSHHQYSQYRSPIEQTYTPSPISSSMSPISPVSSATTPCSALPSSYSTQPQAPPTLTSPILTSPHTAFPPVTTRLPIHTQLPPPHGPSLSSLPSELSSPASASSFRPSKYEWEAAAGFQEPMNFQSSTFKNSHYNTAHYNNPNFQPEAWTPESDDPPVTRKDPPSNRKKSS